MIKKTLIIFTVFILLIIILFSTSSFKQDIVVKQNNYTKKPIQIEKNVYKDRFCNMTIKDIKYSAQVILANNDTLFFDDIGCLILWMQEQKQKDEMVLWVYTEDKYIDARKAWYSLDEFTPMRYGFGAYSVKKDGYIDFNTMSKRVLNNETMANPKTRRHILGKH
ncbi:nitrous oxide reductase accessory protein NosL [Sulfurospirillum sp.]|nr:nitrous oxide reductase accessory protein NosL [Sulfurospirillum sp.]